MSASRVPRFGEGLSDREVEVVRLVASGCSNAEAAARLGLSELTVKTHLFRVSKKLGAKGRLDVVRRVEAAFAPRPLPASEAGRDAAVEAAFVALERLVDGEPWSLVRREALVALTAAGRRGSGGRPLVRAGRVAS